MPKFATECLIYPNEYKSNQTLISELRKRYATCIYDISAEEYRTGLGKEDQTKETKKYNSVQVAITETRIGILE